MNKVVIDKLLAQLPGARILTPLEMNDIHFSGRKTVITPARLIQKKREKPAGRPTEM